MKATDGMARMTTTKNSNQDSFGALFMIFRKNL
jgi:hypothetical protein